MKMHHNKILFIYLLGFLFILSKIHGQESDSLIKNSLFELSFGQSMLFISNSKLVDIRKKEDVVIPTIAILFFAELRPQKKLRIPIFFNLPTETKQFLINGQLVNERASPTFGTGLEFRFFKLKITSKSSLEFENGPLASFLLDTKNSVRVVPIIAGRLRLLRGENFVMYMGSSYSFGINTWGILFGTGTVF